MALSIYVVDAFTTGNNDPFTGNSAAVCLLEYDDDISNEQKQKIAMEMNLSETAFVTYGWTKTEKLITTALDSQVVRRTIRWFTPTNEVPLCGHATVASAKVIYFTQLQNCGDKSISFESKYRGKLGASISGNDGKIILNFPSNPTHSLNPKEHSWLNKMIETTLGSKFESISEVIKDIQYSPGTKILVLRLKDEFGAEGLGNVKPNCQALLEIDTLEFVRDIIVTVKGTGEAGKPDFFSRFFAPWEGIDEDPVTGLAHTVLTPYWTKEMGSVIGNLFARQHSARGGDVVCTLIGDRVQLAGNARIGLKGELYM